MELECTCEGEVRSLRSVPVRWLGSVCVFLQPRHGVSRSIVRRIGSNLPLDTSKRLYIQVGVSLGLACGSHDGTN